MDVLKKKLKDILRIAVICAVFLNTGCQLGYYMKSAYNQLSLLSSREPIDKAIKSDKLTEKEKGKLLLAEKAKIFAEEKLHLTKSKNYSTFAQLDRPYVTYVVSAAPKWELKHYIFSYPIVGDMPYKGFFNEKDAIEEEIELKQKNLDTYRRGVSAYSTLGWFNDPVLSSMLTYSDHDLVNTIIHESVHATLYIKNSADFNERLAVFLGNKGTELYYLETEGADSKTIKMIKEENEDDLIFSKFISQKIIDLEMWYKNNKSGEESLRTEQFDKIKAEFKASVLPMMKTQSYSKFESASLNNARLLIYKTYMQDLSDFEKLFEHLGKDYQKFIEACKNLEKSAKPESDLKALTATLIESPSSCH